MAGSVADFRNPLRFRRISLRLLVLLFGVCAPVVSANAVLPPANSDVGSPASDSGVARLLRDANTALKSGDVKLALIHLKQAVLLQPRNGELHARLGIALLRAGEALAAERELRDAWSDKVSDEAVVPGILEAMLVRGEINELLAEFPDPRQTANNLAPDILRARAMALQTLGRSADANAAMDRSLALRRDVRAVVTRAKLAAQQNDLALAQRLADEAMKLAPNDEDALMVAVLLLRQQGATQKALAVANDFIKRVPGSVVAKAVRVDVLLALKQDVKAQADVDAIVAQFPDLALGVYYKALLTAHANPKAGWREAQSLPPAFVQSRPDIAMSVAQMALDGGSTESGVAILAALVSRHPEVRQARLQLAALRLRQNNPDLALSALEPLVPSDNPQVQAILAQAYLQLGRYPEAISALDKAIAPGAIGGNEFLKRQLALSELQVGDTGKGIQQLQELAARDPGNPDTALQLTVALARSGKFNEALAVTERLAKTQPKSPLPAFYRGLIFGAQVNLAAASTALGQALSIDPKFIPALYYRAGIAMARGSPEDGIKDLQQILAQDPANVPAYMKLAQIALDNDRDAEVAALLGKAIKAAPKDPTPRLALANYQISRANYQEAQATVRDLLQVSPNNAEGLHLRGDIQFAIGAKSEAVETFRLLVAKHPESPDAQILLARALNRSNDRVGAESAATRATELAPASVELRSSLIGFQIAHGKADDALLTAREYRSLYPGPAADLLLAGTLILLKRTAEANKILETSFAARPDRTLALTLSQMAMNLGDTKKALGVLSDWLRKTPNDFEVRRQYASLLWQTGEQTSARREFEVLLKQRPEDPIVLHGLGVLLQKDDPARAFALVSLAAKIAPRSPEIADALGWIKYQRQDTQGAFPLLQRAHALNAADPEIGYHFALALDATGKRAAAKTLLKSVLARNPKFGDAQNAQQLVARW